MAAPTQRTVIHDYSNRSSDAPSVLSSPGEILKDSKNFITTVQRQATDDSREVVAFFTEKTRSASKIVFDKITYLLSYVVSYFVQGIFHPIFFIGYHSFFNLNILGKEKLRTIKGPIIFVSNHIGVYDSFIFDLFVPAFSQSITPFRFMGTTQFEIFYMNILKYTGIVHLVYLLFGVFNVTYGKGAEKALRPAYNIIKNGGTVAIFPEGKVWTSKGKEDKVGPFKWGAAILAKNTGAVVIPVAFNKEDKRFFRDKLTVSIGDPYHVDITDSPEELADDMRQHVLNLFN
jgi:1-acyl-sn-glycerol-3-phosphate acyltransferase